MIKTESVRREGLQGIVSEVFVPLGIFVVIVENKASFFFADCHDWGRMMLETAKTIIHIARASHDRGHILQVVPGEVLGESLERLFEYVVGRVDGMNQIVPKFANQRD